MRQAIPICIALFLVSPIGKTLGQTPQLEGPPIARQYTVGLPDTRQYDCFDLQGNVVDCMTAECPGQDGFYYTGCIPGPLMRWLDQGDGTVIDVCTGLMWQKETADVNGDSMITEADQLPWCDALIYCENLEFAGYDDWRTPNVRELESIVHYGRSGPAMAPIFRAESAPYWTSTTFVGDTSLKWAIDFASGLGAEYDRDMLSSVRAVRGGL